MKPIGHFGLHQPEAQQAPANGVAVRAEWLRSEWGLIGVALGLVGSFLILLPSLCAPEFAFFLLPLAAIVTGVVGVLAGLWSERAGRLLRGACVGFVTAFVLIFFGLAGIIDSLSSCRP